MARMTPDLAKKSLGLQKDGKLSPCPDLPNCVCSQYPQDAKHAIEGLPFSGDASAAKQRLKELCSSLKGAKLADEKGLYLRVEFTSSFFKFVDDVEFLFDDKAKIVHFRSASRLGQWDIGANRKRMESIRKAFALAAG